MVREAGGFLPNPRLALVLYMSPTRKPSILDHVQKPVFTVAEVAALLSLHPLTIRRMASRGELEVVRFGRSVRVPYDALVRLVEERRDSPTAPKGKAR